MTYSFTHGSTDFADLGVYVAGYDVPYLGDPRISRRRLAATSGDVVRAYNRDSYAITLDCVVEYGDPDDPDATLDAITAALSAITETTLALSWEPGKEWTVMLSSGVTYRRMAGGAEFTLTFIVPSGGYDTVGSGA